MEKSTKVTVNGDLAEIFRVLGLSLAQDPLYTKKTLYGQNLHCLDFTRLDRCELHCPVCDKERVFHSRLSRGSGTPKVGQQNATPAALSLSEVVTLSFFCSACDAKQQFFVNTEIKQPEPSSLVGDVSFEKIGENPRLPLRSDSRKRMNKFLKVKDDREDYQKAIICLGSNLGRAAFMYLRGILERRIDLILERLGDEIEMKNSNASYADCLEGLSRLKDPGVPVSSKIDIARKALPDSLKPNGENPLGTLYKAMSEGVHGGWDDEDCLNAAKEIDVALCYLVFTLDDSIVNQKSFCEAVNQIRQASAGKKAREALKQSLASPK